MAFTLELGKPAPNFDLPGSDGKRYTLKDFSDAKVLVVGFTCNHCPYVIGSEERMIRFAHDYASKGVKMVTINSNQTDDYPDDSLEHMIVRAREKKFPFPYLRDETQAVALAYGALRTPHFYLFSREPGGAWVLRYTGRMDDNAKDATKAKTHELTDAVEAVLAGRQPAVPLTNPLGCNVKWKGQDAHWLPADACDLV